MLSFRLLFAVCVCVLFVHDCFGQDRQDARQRYRDKQRRRLAELSRSTTAFGVSLYRQLASRSYGNIVFSPLSVYTALSMTLLGAQGDTKNELKSVLAWRPRHGTHRALHAVFASFPTSSQANVTLRVANSLYYDETRITLVDAFSRAVRVHYEGYPKTFERPEPERPINEWVERETGGMITDFLSQGDITSDTVLVLLNAVFFQGTWRDIFRERDTREGEFNTASGDVVRVPMMSRDGQYAVKAMGEDVGGMVLELPYGSDGRFSMFIMLPDQESTLRDLEGRLSGQVLESAVTNMPTASRYYVTLPKFSLRVKTSMKDHLRALGLDRLFTDAQLTRMVQRTSGRLVVDDVMHEAVIEVDEHGTRAAAVSGVQVSLLSLPPSFTVNRPCLLVLRDNKARINLFLARLHDPTQG